MAGEYKKELMEQIVTTWKANSALNTAVSGGVFRVFTQATGSTMPYCVFFVVADTPLKWASGNNTDEMLVQFTFWDDSADDVILNDIFQKHFAVFDHLTVSATYAAYYFQMEQARGVFRDPESQERKLTLQIDYRVQVTVI